MGLFDTDTATAFRTRSGILRSRFRSLFSDTLDLGAQIDDDDLIDLMIPPDESPCDLLTFKALADIIESGEFTADQLADGICMLVNMGWNAGWQHGNEIGKLMAEPVKGDEE